MGKRKDLSEFDKGQIVLARQLDQSISKTAALVGCSRSAVVSIYQKWSKEGTVVELLLLKLLKKLMLVLIESRKQKCFHGIQAGSFQAEHAESGSSLRDHSSPVDDAVQKALE
ncbi:hypothetical protein QTP70_017121 [Hemibagrus guttatus]|uniref:Uncharacterized protein n=1 Tax=Hemibagrus guttatus TaxID=175788 RepID=A0AAE0QXJ5_9TELE|nr:hypothetical protein QTP70_017121 [Hemibagrus guttatus]